MSLPLIAVVVRSGPLIRNPKPDQGATLGRPGRREAHAQTPSRNGIPLIPLSGGPTQVHAAEMMVGGRKTVPHQLSDAGPFAMEALAEDSDLQDSERGQ